MNRRDFICSLAIVVLTPTLLTGCLPLLRLGLGRGLVRPFLRGAGGSPTFALQTLGRGIAVGARAASLSRVAMPNTTIVSPNARVLATSRAAASGIDLYAPTKMSTREVKVFHSTKRGDGFLHYDLNGKQVGRTVDISRERINYYANQRRERLSAYDLVTKGGRLIRHFKDNGDQYGETHVKVSDEQAELIADRSMHTYFDHLFEGAIFTCKGAAQQHDLILDTQAACHIGDSNACRSLKFDRLRLEKIRKDCR